MSTSSARGASLSNVPEAIPLNSDPELGGDGVASLEEHILETKDAFHESRWRCVTRPGRAQATLGPCATLQISIIQAKSLLSWNASSSSFTRPSKPYIDGYLDDKKVFHTLVGSSSSPTWNHEETVEFTVQTSMVRLMVMDSGGASADGGNEIGFVEFCLGDLAYDYEFEGWLELRFTSKLEGTGTDRYSKHCGQRDEDAKGLDRALREDSSPPSSATGTKTSTAAATDKVQHNAGEMLVKLQLKRMPNCTSLDTTLALVFDPPDPKRFPAKSTLPKNANAKKAAAKASATATKKKTGSDSVEKLRSNKLNVQNLGDHLSDMKIAVYEGAICSTYYFLKYLIHWRCFLLSAPVLVMGISIYLDPWTGWVLWPGFFAVILLVSISPQVRKELTTGGLNAPLTQEGFEKVARWRDTAVMRSYLRRVIETALQGEVTDEQEFDTCAACCFSNGVPKVTYRQLFHILQHAKFTEVKGGALEGGDLVYVDSKRRATVIAVKEESDEVTVRYEDGGSGEATLDISQVVPRLVVPPIPVWALPGGLRNTIISLEHTLGKVSGGLAGLVGKVTDLFSWKSPLISFMVFLLLVAFSAAAATVKLGIWEEPVKVAKTEQGVEHWFQWIMWTLKHHFFFLMEKAWYYAVLCAGVFGFTFWAHWLIELRAVTKILIRTLTMHRLAPMHWAFFRRASLKDKDP